MSSKLSVERDISASLHFEKIITNYYGSGNFYIKIDNDNMGNDNFISTLVQNLYLSCHSEYLTKIDALYEEIPECYFVDLQFRLHDYVDYIDIPRVINVGG